MLNFSLFIDFLGQIDYHEFSKMMIARIAEEEKQEKTLQKVFKVKLWNNKTAKKNKSSLLQSNFSITILMICKTAVLALCIKLMVLALTHTHTHTHIHTHAHERERNTLRRRPVLSNILRFICINYYKLIRDRR